MRVIIEYTKEERVKFISHLDLMRTMQRAVRRAGIPIAYSQGFNPHPVMAFASALPVGVTSEREYMDIILAEPVSLPVLNERLNYALPRGIAIRDSVVTDDKTPSLMSLIERADYRVAGAEWDWEKAVTAYLNEPEIIVEKKGKRGAVSVNLKESIHAVMADEDDPKVLHISMKTGSKGSLKPEIAVKSMLELSEQHFPGDESFGLPAAVHRTGLYILKDGEWVTPLALKKD